MLVNEISTLITHLQMLVNEIPTFITHLQMVVYEIPTLFAVFQRLVNEIRAVITRLQMLVNKIPLLKQIFLADSVKCLLSYTLKRQGWILVALRSLVCVVYFSGLHSATT